MSTDADGAPAPFAPPLAEVPLPAADVAALLQRNVELYGDLPALRFGDTIWSHRELFAEAERFAALYRTRLDPRRPPHIGVLLDNTPDYVFALCGAGLSGVAVAGLNYTRMGEHLARDMSHTDLQLVITEPRHQVQLADALGFAEVPGGVLVSERFADGEDPELRGDPLGAALDAAWVGSSSATAGPLGSGDHDVDALWALLFTSGTSDAPKAVRCTQRRLLTTGSRMSMMLELGPEDVGYAAMPLFHTNSLMAGLAAALVGGASLSLARRFSASGFLPDVRRYGVTWFNYTGKLLTYLLATPARPDDADNTVRVAFGNEGSPQVVEATAERFGMRIIDVFGSTEGAIALDRTGNRPSGSIGRLRQGIIVVNEEGQEAPRALFDSEGRLVNADRCVGEIVNTLGIGPFEGYYRNDEAMSKTTREGWYWSGDLGYVDDDGWVFFAGRTSDWLRVDGENFPAAPVETVLSRHPNVLLASVYGVPDADSGDQVMVALVLRDGTDFDPGDFAGWVDAQGDLGPKWQPRFVRLCAGLPSTPTNKTLTRILVHEKFRSDRVHGDLVFRRLRGDAGFRPFTRKDEEDLRAAFEANGRATAWEL
ncbi:MAG TPA: AMP-binding protein [Acidimicrobiales bacterium]|nr:AMP-binding protein [Acidimicrobiales bacterium]